jgi:NAD(P)-dependent dehydrogenase (short-subunit alcohol dehydrogenase family)
MRLQGKVAIITGAGAGTGRAGALLFAREGAKVVVADIEGDRAEATVKAIREIEGTAIAVKTDVTKESDVKELVQAAVEQFGRLDVMWNNAGVALPGGGAPFDELPEKTLRWIVDVNLMGVVFGCKHAIPPMKRQGGGSIVNTTSTAGLVGYYGWSIYAAAKAGVHGLTRNLAFDLGQYNIRVNTVAPGFGGANFLLPPGAPVVGEEERIRRLAERGQGQSPGGLGTPLKMSRPAALEDIAQAALFFASDDSAYVTGVVLPVDGGLTTRVAMGGPGPQPATTTAQSSAAPSARG